MNWLYKIVDIVDSLKSFQIELKETVKSFFKPMEQWKLVEKNRITEMVKMGWYPNWATFSFISEEDAHKTYDEFMIQRIDENFDDIVKKILSFSENRKDILQNAFDLFKVGNYIACIPLFLIQADGISNEEYGYFFTEKERGKGKAPKLICDKHDIINENNYKYMRDWFFNLVLEIYEMHIANKDTKIKLISNIAQGTDNDKKNGLNRSGILHGDQNHLDYGTKINAHKAFSFLAFIVFSAKDLLQRENEQAK